MNRGNYAQTNKRPDTWNKIFRHRHQLLPDFATRGGCRVESYRETAGKEGVAAGAGEARLAFHPSAHRGAGSGAEPAGTQKRWTLASRAEGGGGGDARTANKSEPSKRARAPRSARPALRTDTRNASRMCARERARTLTLTRRNGPDTALLSAWTALDWTGGLTPHFLVFIYFPFFPWTMAR